eukprot:3383153-Karenia_brevis.AAC.1
MKLNRTRRATILGTIQDPARRATILGKGQSKLMKGKGKETETDPKGHHPRADSGPNPKGYHPREAS